MKNGPTNTNSNDETKRDPRQTVYSNEHLMEGKMEFTGFGCADNERGESRQIVINSELFYLCGIRGINRGFGFGFCTIQSGSARQSGFLYVFVCALVCLCRCVSACMCVCLTVLNGSVSVPVGF